MKHIFKKIVGFTLILISVVAFISVFIRASVYAPADEVAPPIALAKVAEAHKNKPGHSARISIPTLDINARVQEVGITRKGNISTPSNYTDTGWYKYGPLPGEPGTAIIAGHVDNGLALPGVFKNLDNIAMGDSVYIETKEGKKLHFIVTNISTYDYNAPTGEIFKKSTKPTLLLITCTGNWVQEIKTHDKRLVVTTTLYES